MSSCNPPRKEQIVQLKDGRTLGYAEYGDPRGKPLFSFHGWPSSRLHAGRIDAAAKKLKVRIISPDRPGYGLSDYQPDRTLLDWPNNIVELADKLEINKFAILGISGGGPYAAACAYKIPKRVTKAGIVVGLAPTYIKGILTEMTWINKFGWANFQRFPILTQASAFFGWIETILLPTNISSYFVAAKPERSMLTGSLRKATHLSRKEAFKQGIKAAALDLKLYSNSWGFDLKKIKAPVYLWYGDADRSVSLAMGKYYASQIQNSKLVIFPGEGHYCLITHADEILKAITT